MTTNTYTAPLPLGNGNGQTVAFQGLFDVAGQQFVAFQAGTVVSNAGQPVAPMLVQQTNITAGANTTVTVPSNVTVANTDTSATFGATVNHWTIQNNTGANVFYNLDAAASASTFLLVPGAQVWWDWPVTVVHLFTVAAQNVNTGATPIVLIGRV